MEEWQWKALCEVLYLYELNSTSSKIQARNMSSKRLTSNCAHSFAKNWHLPFLNQKKGENEHRNYFLISLYKRMLLDPAGIKPSTSPSQVRCASHWAWLISLGPVVQSVVSLTSSLRVISLTILADSIYNILIFFCWKNVSSFCTAKATHIFSAKNFSIFGYHLM